MRLTTRHAKALIVAMILGCLFGLVVKVSAQDDDEGQPIYYPGICLVLERHSKWWIFWECERFDTELLSETVLVVEADGERTTHVERVRENGSIDRFTRRQRIKER